MFSASLGRKFGRVATPAVLGGAALIAAERDASLGVSKCNEDHIPSIDLGWSHHGALASFDYRAFAEASRCTVKCALAATRSTRSLFVHWWA